MIARRDVLGGGMVASLFASGSTAAEPQMSERSAADIASVLRDIRATLENAQRFPEIGSVRARIVEFLRANMKFPDSMDLGTDPWFGVYDWHIKHLQPLVLGRDAAGRYTIRLLDTTLVMRPDLAPNYMGLPYDNR